MSLVLFWCIRLNRGTLILFIDEYFQPEYLDAEVVSSTESRFKKISIKFLVGYWAFHSNVVVSTFVSAFFTRGFKDKQSYVVPSVYECPTKPRNNNTNWFASVCWNIDTVGKYLSVNGFVSSMYLLILIPFATSFLFYLFVIVYINVNLDVFKRKMVTLTMLLPHYEGRLSQKRSQMNTQVAAHGALLEAMHYYTKLRG